MFFQITNLDRPELEPYRTLRRPEDHWRRRIFVAEGEKVVRRLMQTELSIISFLMTPQWKQQIFPDNDAAAPVYIASKDLLETIVGFPLHQGIMAVAKMPEEGSLSELLSVHKEPLIVALDGVVNAENVGVAVRNCAAFGADAILIDQTSSSPWLRRSVRNSMGGIFQIKSFHVPDLAQQLAELKQSYGMRIIAAHPAGNSQLNSIDLKRGIVLVFGNEGHGISERTLKAADHAVSIPMSNNTDSLNVASAIAVFLYVASLQRNS
ncbi:MAG TPA: RNA methyltransferase [Acidobacteriota bacterium]